MTDDPEARHIAAAVAALDDPDCRRKPPEMAVDTPSREAHRAPAGPLREPAPDDSR